MVWSNVTLGEVTSRLLRNTSERFPADERNEKAAASAMREIGELLGIVDAALEGKSHLVGEGFTLADLAIAGFLPFLARLGADLGPHERVQEWLGRCVTRPALARSMQG